jgi:hypothetical protein
MTRSKVAAQKYGFEVLNLLSQSQEPESHREHADDRDQPVDNRAQLNDSDLQDVTSKEAQQIDRLYNQLESTGGHPQVTSNESQGSDELDETGLAKEIDEENRRLDRIDNIRRGC